jgi:hypothetical protein
MRNHKQKHMQREDNMKKPTRNITMLVLGLLLTALPAGATTWNVDAHAGWWGNGWTSYTLGGGSVNAPSNATIGWYAYAYSPVYAFARVIVYVNGSGPVIDQSVSANGSNSGNQPISQAGTVNVYLETGASTYEDQNGVTQYQGGTGCGVTVAW